MTNTPVIIRPETASDSAAIEAVTVAAFREAPHSSHTESFIISALRAAGALSVSLVAEAQTTLIGHVAASPVTLSDWTPCWFGLGPVSVYPGHQGQGTGSRLMRAALETLRTMGAAGCVVLGDPGYYSRFGFRPEKNLVLANVPPEYFQALAFTDGDLPRGMVTYHDAFSAQA